MPAPHKPRPGLLVVDHGSRRAAANDDLRWISASVQAMRPEALVRTAHMELAEPSIATGIDSLVAAGCCNIIVLPFFLSQGRHLTKDVPELVAAAVARHANVQATVAPALGPCPELAALLLKRANLITGVEAAPGQAKIEKVEKAP